MPPQRHLPHSIEPKSRQRGSKACGPCRKRKIKCDGMDPCTGCSVYGYECAYVEVALQTKVLSAPTATQVWSTADSDIIQVPAPESTGQEDSYIATESIVQDPAGYCLLKEQLKTRFTTSDSAIAHPKILGKALGMDNPPRLHSFGWNTGARSEPRIDPGKSICDIISLDQMKQFASVYFTEVHHIFGMFNQESFQAHSADYWTVPKHGRDFEACLCGVVALGSFFSGSEACSAEAEVVEHGRVLLDLSLAHTPLLLSVKHVVAWVLRAIYLRCTTRPHLSWMASCSAIHIAEALGLHREITGIQMQRDISRELPASEVDMRRRTFCKSSNTRDVRVSPVATQPRRYKLL